MSNPGRAGRGNGGRDTSGFYSPSYPTGTSGGHPAGDTCLMALLVLPFTLAMAPVKLGLKAFRKN